MDERGEQIQVGGAAAGPSCPTCGTTNPPDARFCQSCGTQLPDLAEPDLPQPSEPRVVTVLAAIVLAEGDDAARSLRRVRSRLASAIGRHGGALIDDDRGIAAVFGFHPAHGDGALRAVRAAADLCEAAPAIRISSERAGDPPFEITIGVEVADAGPDPSGIDLAPAFDLARRARTDQVVLSAKAHRRAGPASVEVAPLDGEQRGEAAADELSADEGDERGDEAPEGPDEPATEAEDGSTLDTPDAIDPLEALEGALDDAGADDAGADDSGPDGDPAGSAESAEDADGAEDDPPVRLVSVVAASAGQAPTLHAPIVGRDAERVALRELFERALQEHACVAVTVVGSPGVGKTRLAEALIGWAASTHDAIAIRVRCRDASEGGATWPVPELIEQAIGATLGDTTDDVARALDRVLLDAPDAQIVRERLTHLLAMPDGRSVAEETPWAIRRLLEIVAASRPVIVSIDDADGADPSFARLLRSVADRVKAPVLMLATGRSDPLHGTADENAVATITLEPLDGDGVRQLLEALVGRTAFGEKAQQRVATATGGNPFLIEQLTCMLVDEGLLRWDEGRWLPTTDLSAMPTPPNVAALMDARLQAASADERAVLERLAVAGERIRWDGFLSVLPEDVRPTAGDRVAGLVRKQLIRGPDGPQDDLVVVGHTFVREAAARAAAGQVRAEVYESFARWLADAAADRAGRFDEPIGSAFERAFRSWSGVGGPEGTTRALAREASTRLDAAARRAAEIGDAQGAFQLAQRAASLLGRDDPARPDLLLRAAIALVDLGQFPRADALLTETAHAARATGARAVEWRAKVLRARLTARSGTDHRALESARRRADRSIGVFRDLGDDWGLSWAYSLSAYVSLCRGHASAEAAAASRAVEAARRAGAAREEAEALRALARALGDGPTPLGESASRLASIVDRIGDTYRPVAQEALGILAIVQADRGNTDEARTLDERAGAIVDELGLELERPVRAERSGLVRLLTGDADGARAALGEGLELAERFRDRASAARIAALLAHVLEDAGDYGEAVRLTEVAEQGVGPSDVATAVRWRTARARALAHGGNLRQANTLAREAVRLADQTDAVELRATALVELAEVLRLSGRRNEAMPLVRRALRAFARKGALTRASRAQRSLDLLDTDDDVASAAEGPPTPPPEPPAAEPVAYAHVGSTAATAVGAPEAPEAGDVTGGDGSAGAVTGLAPTPEAVAPPPPPDPVEPEAFGDRIEQEFAALHSGPEPTGTNGDRGESPEAGNAEADREAEGERGATEGKGRKGLRFW